METQNNLEKITKEDMEFKLLLDEEPTPEDIRLLENLCQIETDYSNSLELKLGGAEEIMRQNYPDRFLKYISETLGGKACLGLAKVINKGFEGLWVGATVYAEGIKGFPLEDVQSRGYNVEEIENMGVLGMYDIHVNSSMGEVVYNQPTSTRITKKFDYYGLDPQKFKSDKTREKTFGEERVISVVEHNGELKLEKMPHQKIREDKTLLAFPGIVGKQVERLIWFNDGEGNYGGEWDINTLKQKRGYFFNGSYIEIRGPNFYRARSIIQGLRKRNPILRQGEK